MSKLRSLKIAGALLLLISLALPMSSCRHYVDARGERLEVPAGQTPPQGAREVVSYHYAFEGFNVREPDSWLLLLQFLWPALFLGVQLRLRRGRTMVALRILEIPLLVYSSVLIDLNAGLFASRLEAGAYLAFSALGFYSIGAIGEDVGAFRRWRRERLDRGRR